MQLSFLKGVFRLHRYLLEKNWLHSTHRPPCIASDLRHMLVVSRGFGIKMQVFLASLMTSQFRRDILART
eukprot:3586545-Amphidinium_carterae.1